MTVIRVRGEDSQMLDPAPYSSESELEDVLAAHHRLLLEPDDPDMALVTRQLHLSQAGIADMLFVDAVGSPIVVEVKLGRNPQSRREVIAQVFDYASSLADWTADELDDKTGGKLDEALSSVVSEEAAFKGVWRNLAANLRSGSVRVVVAVDERGDELERVISFINDHSDLDVRLVVIEKHAETDGSIVFSSTTDVWTQGVKTGGGLSKVVSEKARRLQELVDLHTALGVEGAAAFGTAKGHRVVHIDGWPGAAVHYAFHVKSRAFAELRVVSPDYSYLKPLLEELGRELAREFSDVPSQFDPSWGRGCCRLRLIHDRSTPLNEVASNMRRLIDLTRERVQAALESHYDLTG